MKEIDVQKLMEITDKLKINTKKQTDRLWEAVSELQIAVDKLKEK